MRLDYETGKREFIREVAPGEADFEGQRSEPPKCWRSHISNL